MRVTFEFYGVLQRLAGAPQRAIEVDAAGAMIGAALERLAREVPALAGELERSACAVGDALVSRSDRLAGDLTIAVLPPVAGG